MFLISKRVFEQGAGGETTPTNRTERPDGLLMHPCNGTRSYSRASHLICLVVQCSGGSSVVVPHGWLDGWSPPPIPTAAAGEVSSSPFPPKKIEFLSLAHSSILLLIYKARDSLSLSVTLDSRNLAQKCLASPCRPIARRDFRVNNREEGRETERRCDFVTNVRFCRKRGKGEVGGEVGRRLEAIID